ncbi:hypothetical protein C8R45DRAFT_756652, partial [Mycena sanguinolenta]
SAHSACMLCLGCFSHDINSCNSSTLWNGEPTFCTRDHDSYLITSNGSQLCLKWQLHHPC